jgi:hypothetical protein
VPLAMPTMAQKPNYLPSQRRHAPCLTVLAGVLTVLGWATGALCCSKDWAPMTCDRARIDPVSYELTTKGVASIMETGDAEAWHQIDHSTDRESRGDLDEGALQAATRARRIDFKNQMAVATIVRQLITLGQANIAVDVWHHLGKAGGRVMWPVTLPDLRERQLLYLAAFGTDGLSLYTMTRKDDSYWATLAGCPSDHAAPRVDIPWSEVTAIEAQEGALSFALLKPLHLAGLRQRHVQSLRMGLVSVASSDKAGVSRKGLEESLRSMLLSVVNPRVTQ